MQDPEKLREIECLGETDGEPQAEWPEESRESRDWGGALTIQTVICVLILLMIVFFKLTDGERFQEIGQWYREEMSQEIELPRLRGSVPGPNASPTPVPSPDPPPSSQPDEDAQQL